MTVLDPQTGVPLLGQRAVKPMVVANGVRATAMTINGNPAVGFDFVLDDQHYPRMVFMFEIEDAERVKELVAATVDSAVEMIRVNQLPVLTGQEIRELVCGSCANESHHECESPHEIAEDGVSASACCCVGVIGSNSQGEPVRLTPLEATDSDPDQPKGIT
jgi:hypothetical protein